MAHTTDNMIQIFFMIINKNFPIWTLERIQIYNIFSNFFNLIAEVNVIAEVTFEEIKHLLKYLNNNSVCYNSNQRKSEKFIKIIIPILNYL